ncbi:MAG: DNA cytosine methyltransferase [Clostridia bacterium]|nr:DNA cytosine methyltransferase [Clostridia bacterium]
MRVLVACEESQRVTIEFRKLGHQAFSCDIKDCSGGFPEWHIKGDCIPVIEHNSWDLIIAHPPCTYLSVAGACNLVNSKGEIINQRRYEKMLESREFFMYFYKLTGSRVCIENPRAMARAELPPWSQVIQPFQFGENYSKQTCLWLKGLPYLIPDCYAVNKRSFGDSWCAVHRSPGVRSKTFVGIARAMAQQWGNLE